ncbi:MAG: helix-turn-helix domain-containing protein, partial [Actinomycetota bacterium]|nr:helix-turn-helix domain-containing protein [Actinomycetota bacterium]
MLATLRTFIECNGSNRVTAERLGVHENTVRYRLTRIRELSGKDPTRFDDLVDLRFALHVLDLAGDAESDDASPPAY